MISGLSEVKKPDQFIFTALPQSFYSLPDFFFVKESRSSLNPIYLVSKIKLPGQKKQNHLLLL